MLFLKTTYQFLLSIIPSHIVYVIVYSDIKCILYRFEKKRNQILRVPLQYHPRFYHVKIQRCSYFFFQKAATIDACFQCNTKHLIIINVIIVYSASIL